MSIQRRESMWFSLLLIKYNMAGLCLDIFMAVSMEYKKEIIRTKLTL